MCPVFSALFCSDENQGYAGVNEVRKYVTLVADFDMLQEEIKPRCFISLRTKHQIQMALTDSFSNIVGTSLETM